MESIIQANIHDKTVRVVDYATQVITSRSMTDKEYQGYLKAYKPEPAMEEGLV